MAREINPTCNLIFGSIHTCLLTDTVDVELTIRMVKGIYTYCKEHTTESTVFLSWSKTMIPFPSLRQKIQAYKIMLNKRQCHGTMVQCPNSPLCRNLPETLENFPQAK